VLLLTIEYDVAIVDRGQFALHSPLLVEVEKSPCALLGIHLGTEGQNNRIGASTGIFIESIEPASIAERYVNFIIFSCVFFNRLRHVGISTFNFQMRSFTIRRSNFGGG
jgi:hypothetical protein